MSGYGEFWHDILALGVSRGHALAPLDVVRRMAAHDDAYGGPVRRDDSTLAFGALIPVEPAVDAASGPPVSRRPFLDALARSESAVTFPDAGMVVTVPVAQTNGVTAYASQSSENSSVTESNPGPFTNVSTTISTAVARVEISRQAYERGAVEGTLTRVVRWALDSVVEAQVIATLLASSSFVSLTDTTGGGAVKATMNAASNVAGAMAARAQFALLAPRRFDHWAAQAVSTTNLPVNFETPSVGGLLVIPSGGVSTTTSTSQDRIHVSRWDALIWSEDAPRVQVFPGGADAGSGVVQILASQYYAFNTRGVVSAVQSVSGTGLMTPSFV